MKKLEKSEKEFAKILSELPKRLHDSSLRSIARKGARVVIKAARERVRVQGQLGRQIKSDIGISNDSKNKRGVKVKLRNKYYADKDGKQRVVKKIAGHFTEGVKQSNRKGRGKVKQRYPDFVKEAGKAKENEVINVMKNEGKVIIQKTIAKWRRKLV